MSIIEKSGKIKNCRNFEKSRKKILHLVEGNTFHMDSEIIHITFFCDLKEDVLI